MKNLSFRLQVISSKVKLSIPAEEEILYLGLVRIMCFTASTKKGSVIFSLTLQHTGNIFRGIALYSNTETQFSDLQTTKLWSEERMNYYMELLQRTANSSVNIH
jgi:hypothetical protein